MVMEEMKQLFTSVNFEDLTQDVIREMCEIIVKGKQVDYRFRPSQHSPGSYTAKIPNQRHCIYITGNELTERLLIRSGLIEATHTLDENQIPNTILKPTQKSIHFYKRLRSEGYLDERGYSKSISMSQS